VPKTGATLMRQWRGHTHTVLVREDGFEYEGQCYRSLTVIAEQITGAHCRVRLPDSHRRILSILIAGLLRRLIRRPRV
jgi:hypothetical protein